MASQTSGDFLYDLYANRIGRPTMPDEVRGYWVFLTGLVLGIGGMALFLPSESAAGASGLTLREVSIFVAAVGLAMLVAGPSSGCRCSRGRTTRPTSGSSSASRPPCGSCWCSRASGASRPGASR